MAADMRFLLLQHASWIGQMDRWKTCCQWMKLGRLWFI